MTGITITKAGEEPGAKSLRVEVPPERVHAAEETAAREFARRARLPGFRKGKAPLAVVKRRYHDAIREQVLRDVIGESWKAALEQEDLKPIADPHVHHLKFEAGEPLTFEFHVEVKPELKLERLGGFDLTRTVEPVTDETVSAQLESLQRERAPWVPVEGARAARGDLATVTLATLTDGEPGEPKQYHVVLGQGQAIPDVETRIMEMDVGQTQDADVRFPEDFPDEARRGQTRQVRLTLHEVKRQQLPALDDAFAREVGDFDSLADLRARVREDLELEARREADTGVRRALVEQIVTANGVQAPRPLVERMLGAYAKVSQVPDDQLEKFAQDLAPLAEEQVKRDLVLEYVAQQEHLEATEAELDERIAEIAKRRGAAPKEVYASLQKAGRLRELERTITEEKVFEHLLAQSTVTES